MKVKSIMIMAILFVSILAIGAVSAADSNATDNVIIDEMDIDDNNQDININNDEKTLKSFEDAEKEIGQTDESALSYSVEVSSYSDLVNRIEEIKNTNYSTYTLNLKAGTYVATQYLELEDPDDSTGTKTVIINGNGATLDGDHKYGFIFVDNNYALKLNNVKIKNYAKNEEYGRVIYIYGGAIYSSGTLIIDGCEFENNHGKEGGAIYAYHKLNITNTLFTGNTALDDGGAIYLNGGECEIQTSTFTYNKAEEYGGAIYGGTDGAIITNNVFENNEAEAGGAISNGYSMTMSYSPGVVVYDRWGNRIDEIQGNTQYFGLNVDITKNTFSNNKAKSGAAIRNVANSVLMDSNTFYSNHADSTSSGVIVNTAENAEITGNTLKTTKYASTLLNSGEFSRISNNMFADQQPIASTIIAEDISKVQGGLEKLTITLKDVKGNPIANSNVKVTLNGITSTLSTDNNGQSSMAIDLSVGTYKASITFDGAGKYTSATKTVNVNVKKQTPVLTANSVSYVYGNSKLLTVNLNEIDGTPIANREIAIRFVNANGDSDYEYFTTDENGQITADTSKFSPDTYTAYINSNDCKEIKTTVTVKKATPKITAKAKTFKKSDKTKKYTVTLKNNKKLVNGVTVKITVNKKTYSAKTNSKGVATFKLTKLTKKGKFTATVKSVANKYYNAKTLKNVKITVK